MKRLKSEGWTVNLIYVALPQMEVSKVRVKERHAHGGHDVPTADIERRFPRSLENLFERYRHVVDSCLCFMNHCEVPVLVFEQAGEYLKVIDEKMLSSYRLAVTKELEKKRKLDQYPVIWNGEKPVEIRGDELSIESK